MHMHVYSVAWDAQVVVVRCSLGSHQLSSFAPSYAAHGKGAAGSLVVIASAYLLCSVHVLCVYVLFVIIMLCVPCMFVWPSVLCDQEHTFPSLR